MYITGIYYYPSQKIGLKDIIFKLVTLTKRVLNTYLMVYQDHFMSYCE